MKYDIIVIGGGHAGIEAVNSAAKSGLSVLLITAHVDLIGQMSCNPAIGGIAKGNIVREIDALGGLMGRIIDRVGIQFRMLNKSKGVAVWGPRAQADKAAYRTLCRKYVEELNNVAIFQDMVTAVLVSNGRVCGVETESGQTIEAAAVVLTMGTFLNGLAHIGQNSFPCGRLGESASFRLSESLQELGVTAGRLKTGTPARIDGKTVDFSKMTEQLGDENPWPFSYSTTNNLENKIVCWELKTTEKTHNIIRNNLEKSPIYSGKIVGIGPRYCPSIEDKVVRFGDRNGHTLFLEPEGIDTHEIYLNGFSTSLPFDVQEKMVHSLAGLEKTRMTRPAYAIEYDYFHPVQLFATLESRKVEHLFFAGQINGTSGYEEAACQGLIAGLNAAKRVCDRECLVLGRDSSYTGVLIDDLVTKGTEEPYRMFTSRAEYRLLLRQDNADERLMPLARQHGLIEESIYQQREKLWAERDECKRVLFAARITPESWEAAHKDIKTEIKQKIPAAKLLKRPQVTIEDVFEILEIELADRAQKITIEADIKYDGFIHKQKKEIERQKRIEETKLPSDIDYDSIQGLLTESRSKLNTIKPLTIGQASRISGVTPADVSVLIMHIIRNK